MFNLCSKIPYATAPRWGLALVLICCAATSIHAQETADTGTAGENALAGTQQTAGDSPTTRHIQTDSPRATLTSFLRLRDQLELTLRAYRLNKTTELFEELEVISSQFIALLDLSSVPPLSRPKTGTETTAYLLDIFGRIKLPDLESIPGQEAFDKDGSSAKWRIPSTPIWIVQVDQGPHEGEFLFGESTILVAPRFYQGIKNLPLQSSLSIISWHRALPQVTGAMIPAVVLRYIPESLRGLWLDTPKWKVIAVALLSVLAILLLSILHRAINIRKIENRFGDLLRRALRPISILVVLWSLEDFIDHQLFVSGALSTLVVDIGTILIHASLIWLSWVIILAIAERIIQAKGIPEDAFDAHLWRIGSRAVGIVAGVVIIGYSAQEMGLPLYSVVTGLGIGGLAVALAIRPNLENLIACIVLYLDRPVRVGDFCSFGDRIGTIEAIGVRTTKIRALDRTLITIPNATFAEMELTNWAKCDQMLINTTIGLRYETEIDQLRHVLVKFREMLHAHPKIDTETVRVRLTDFGKSSLDIEVRIYALTQEWNEYYAIREDVLLRLSEIVKRSGSGFAFPSRTLYMGRDQGLDVVRGKDAAKEVESWRKAGKLPFPRLSPDRIEQIAGTLDYPPLGSVEAGSVEPQVWESTESLSAEQDDADKSDPESPSPKPEDAS